MSDTVDKMYVYRSPTSFDTIVAHEAASRILLVKTESEEYFKRYSPETVDKKYLTDKLEELGYLERDETYLCPSTLLDIHRGWIIDSGQKYFYYVYSTPFGLYKSTVDGVIASLDHTIRSRK